MSEIINQTIGENIRNTRRVTRIEGRYLSQEKLAERCNLPLSRVKKIENGAACYFDELYAIAEALETEYTSLLPDYLGLN